MKRTILAAVVLAGSTLAVNADTLSTVKTGIVISVVEEKVKINPEELPDAVKKTLATDEYKDWTVSAAYVYKESQTYEVEVKKGEETKTFKFDKEGKLVK